MTDPCVAIVTRTQNRPLTLDRTMRSILAQRFQDWQMVLVSDAGNLDSIRQVLARYADAMRGRCLLLHRETSTGMEAASNFGMSRSSSRYVVVHDDDDSWHPDFLGKAVAFLRSFGDTFQGVVTGTELVFERIDNGAIRELRREAMARPPDPLTPAALRRRNRFPPISFLYERKAGQLAGGYREDLRALGDWEFNVRFAAHFRIGQIPDTLAYWHHRPKAPAGSRSYANSPYHDHMESLMRLKREWGQCRPLWRYLMWWRY